MSRWWDDSSTLVPDPSSPPLSADDVNAATSTANSSQSAPQPSPSAPPFPPERPSSSPAGSGGSKHASPSHKHHGIFSKKSKAAKGLSFLIKASKETARRRSKSPSKSPSQENLAEDLHPVDDQVKAKSEQWQAFLQMQDRIKLNVLKTQQSIGKLAAGRISPSGRISPAKRGQLKPDEDEDEDEDADEESAVSTPWTNQGRDDEAWTEDSAAQGERVGPWRGLEGDDDEEKTHSEDTQLIDKEDKELLSSGLRDLPHLRVTSARPQDSRLKLEQDGEVDLLSGFKPVPPSTPVDPEIEEVDLLGLGVVEPSGGGGGDGSGSQPAVPFVLNEDLLGLDDLLGSSSGPSADARSVEGTDWFTGSSTAYSSSQSSLCSSPVAFDLDFFLEQERFVSGSTAVSDLARTLVDDFLQWGAEAEKESQDLWPSSSSSSNPFAADISSAAAANKTSVNNPFATASQSDDTDTAIGFRQKVPPSADTGFDALDPFRTVSSARMATGDSGSFSADPFSCVHVAAPVTSGGGGGGRDLDPFRTTTDSGDTSTDMPLDSRVNLDPFSSTALVPDTCAAPSSESGVSSDPFSSLAVAVSTASESRSEVDVDPFGFMATGSADLRIPSTTGAGLDPFGAVDVVSTTSESSFLKADAFGCTAVTSITSEAPSFSHVDVDPFESVIIASHTSEIPRDSGDNLDPFGCPLSAPSEPASLDFNANPRAPPADSSLPASDVTDSTSKPSALNPFLAEPGEEQTSSQSAASFDEDFFSRKTSSQVQQDADSIWGTGAQETSAAAFNPFENDLFVGADIPAIRSDDGGAEGLGSVQPVNPFLTASFENLSISAVPVANVHKLFVASTDELDRIGGGGGGESAPSVEPSVPADPFDPFSGSAAPTSQTEAVPVSDHPPAEEADTATLFDKTEEDQNDDEDEDTAFKLHIRAEPIKSDGAAAAPVPFLPPPPTRPKSPPVSSRENPFDKDSPPEENFASFEVVEEKPKEVVEPRGVLKSMSSESSTYDEENLEPLEPFLPVTTKTCWKLMLRYPLKKKLAGNRYWKTVYAVVELLKDGPVLKAYEKENCEGEVLQELPLQPCYSLSELTAQQFDQYGKIHTVKVQYIFYRERVGIKPERITPSFVKKPKATMVLDHAPQVSELLKFGSLDKEEMHTFIHHMEDAFMKMDVKREKTLTYTKDEIQAEVWDEYMAVIDRDGHTTSQKARVRIFVLAFLTGMPACELGINDKMREGKEVVGRHDIIPVRTEDWIRIESPEFHSVVDLDTFENTSTIRFRPLDACQFELLRFRVRPRENRELPLQLRATQLMKDRHFELRCDMLVTGYHAFSKKCGQFPCEDIEIRFKIPEKWIYYFRYERKFRYGSLKAMTRKPGKIKGLERLTMMAQGMLSPALMEASVGSAKYEHVHRSVVWRVARLPERNQGAYKNHMFVLRLDLGPHDDVPGSFEDWCDVEFTTPATTVSKAQVRSISVENPDPPEKWVRYLAKYRYRVQLDNKVETASDVEHDDE